MVENLAPSRLATDSDIMDRASFTLKQTFKLYSLSHMTGEKAAILEVPVLQSELTAFGQQKTVIKKMRKAGSCAKAGIQALLYHTK